MRARFRRFLRDRTGSTAIEYALMGSLLAIAAITGARALGLEVTNMYDGQAAVVENSWRR